ncbi:long tail fiber protein [Synechococcus phage S-CRES3]|nr:long tail fiber protein [Synechococcus phage S-CRES3]
MPTPSPRNSIRIARGNYADLLASVSDIGEGELCFALDQDKFYSKSSGVLVEVGKGTALYTINQLGDVDTSTAAPSNGDFLQWDGANWVPGTSSGAPVDSVNGQTGVVALDADDISDAATTNKYTTAADISKLAGIEAGAEVNVNADWNAVSGDAQILNKPTLGTAAASDTTDFATAAQGTTADSALQPADIGVTVQAFDATLLSDADIGVTVQAYDATLLNDADIGVTLQAYDADNVVSDTAPTFTATVQTTERTITAGAFDLATGNNWTCGAITIPNPTNAVVSTSGIIRLTAAPTGWGVNFKHPGGTTVSPTSFPAIVPFYVESSSVILLGNPVEGIA